ncbi:hypothetical protein SESBI_39284 [Sesbania bispinosa]|nr:hypothetical protein SESBI_39284 [Sesbania bispinosa]
MVFSAGSGFQKAVPPEEVEADHSTKPSFKDKVMGSKAMETERRHKDLIGEKIMQTPTKLKNGDAQVFDQGVGGATAQSTVQAAARVATNHNPSGEDGSKSVTESSLKKIPEDMHGDWLVVSRRKKGQKQKEIKAKNGEHKETFKGNRFESLNVIDKESSISQSQVQTEPIIREQQSNITKDKVWHRKRARKDNVALVIKEPGGAKIVTDQHVVSSISTTKLVEKPATVMIGNMKVFDLGGGTKSTMNLCKVGPKRYKFQEEGSTSLKHDNEEASEDHVPHVADLDNMVKIVDDPSQVDRGTNSDNMLIEM